MEKPTRKLRNAKISLEKLTYEKFRKILRIPESCTYVETYEKFGKNLGTS